MSNQTILNHADQAWSIPPAVQPAKLGASRIVPSTKPKVFTCTNTNALMKAVFDPIRWVVGKYVPEGFNVLAGRQKLGKTWLALDWALAVACGGYAMGSVKCEQGDVLYIDMENGPRRIQRRIAGTRLDYARTDLSRLAWVTETVLLNNGFLERLDQWRLNVAAPRLVVIDVLQRIKPAGNPAHNMYENDYSAWAPLQRWAMQHGIAVVGLHHTRKGGADDPLEALSGSNGLSACADTTLLLDRDSNGTTLYVRGRDVDEKEIALHFAAGLWSILGNAEEVRTTNERQSILKALREAGVPQSPKELADATGMKDQNVRQLLRRMGKAGSVKNAERGRYVPSDAQLSRVDASGGPTTSPRNGSSPEKALPAIPGAQ